MNAASACANALPAELLDLSFECFDVPYRQLDLSFFRHFFFSARSFAGDRLLRLADFR